MSNTGIDEATLWKACQDGKYEEVKECLKEPLDIGKEDSSGISPFVCANYENNYMCAALIAEEAMKRASDPKHPYRVTLRQKIEEKCKNKEFDEDIFRQAVDNEPQEAYKYLTQFVKNPSHKYEFEDLKPIFGTNDVKTSALASILSDTIEPSQKDEKLKLLQHPVLRRVLDIKWELFAAREYYLHLLLYILMLTAITNVVVSLQDIEKQVRANATSKPIDENVWIQPSFITQSFANVFCVIGLYYLRYLEPSEFSTLTHNLMKTSWENRPDVRSSNQGMPIINHRKIYKAQAHRWLLGQTLKYTLIIVIAYLGIVQFLLPKLNLDFVFYIIICHCWTTFTALWLCAGYFLILEVRELLAEDPWIFYEIENSFGLEKLFWRMMLPFASVATIFMRSHRKYFASWTNLLQVVTYFTVLVPFAILHAMRIFNMMHCNGCDNVLASTTKNALDEMHLLPSTVNNIYFCIGAFCAASLWILSLQFFEVHKTAGYLLPILFDAFMDAWYYLIFYGVFQCGLSCAFYFLVQQKDPAYSTLWASFCSTFFVTFGDNGVDNLISADLPYALSKLALVLRMLNCALMVVVLLNLLLATINKTVDRNWDNLHARALTSYAQTVFRIEKMLFSTPASFQLLTKTKTQNDGKSPENCCIWIGHAFNRIPTDVNEIFQEEVLISDLAYHDSISDKAEFDKDNTATEDCSKCSVYCKEENLNEIKKKLEEQNNKLEKEVQALHAAISQSIHKMKGDLISVEQDLCAARKGFGHYYV